MSGEDAVSEAEQRDQRLLVRALTDPACYPHRVERVHLIETLISYVLLTGRFAYKIKKPLDLGFLDFSTLAARRFYCTEELRLNRRLAPQLYLDVVAIAGSAAAPRMEAPGMPIEYALKMAEFPQQALLDAVLARGELMPRHIDELAAALADFHAGSARAAVEDAGGAAERVRAPMEQNFAQLRPLLRSAAEARVLDILHAWSEGEQDRLEALFATRHGDGFVRECHGDLHLGNIALVSGTLQIFDCIEFNADLRWIDIMSEIAFLVMDLAQRRRRDYAARLLNAYLERSGDYAGIETLRYYLVYRSLVRAKVVRLRARQGQCGVAAGAAAQDAAYRRYVAYARRVIAPRRPALIIMHGAAGSGKTTFAQAVLEEAGAIRLRSDVERKRIHGLSVQASSGAQLGAGIYGAQATRETYAALARLAHAVLAAGFTVIVDAAFLERWQRDDFRMVAARCAVPFCILSLRAGRATLERRICARSAAGGDASEATTAVLERQLASGEALQPDELAAAIEVDSELQAPAQLARMVRDRLRQALR